MHVINGSRSSAPCEEEKPYPIFDHVDQWRSNLSVERRISIEIGSPNAISPVNYLFGIKKSGLAPLQPQIDQFQLKKQSVMVPEISYLN